MRFLSALVLSVFASQAYAPGGMVNVRFEGEDGNTERVRFSYSDREAFKEGLKKLYKASDDERVSAWQDLTKEFYKLLEIRRMEDAEKYSKKSAKPRANVRAAENILKVLSWDKKQVRDKIDTQEGPVKCVRYSLKERYKSTPLPQPKSFDIKHFLNPNGQLTGKGSAFLHIIAKVTFDDEGIGDEKSVTHAIKAVKEDADLAVLAKGKNEETLRWLLTNEHGHKARPLIRGCFFRGYTSATGIPLVEKDKDGRLKPSTESLSYFENGMSPRHGRKEDGLSEEADIDFLGGQPSLALAGIKGGVTGGWGNSCTRKVAIAKKYAKGPNSAIFLIDSDHPDVIAHDVGGQLDQVNLETTPGKCIRGVWHPDYPDQFIPNTRYEHTTPTPENFDALFQDNAHLKSFLDEA